MTHHQELGDNPAAPPVAYARFSIGDVVRHRLFDFRGVIFDVDPVFANSEEWYQAIPLEIRPSKEQPFYHLLAENGDGSYVAYVSQQNLVADDEDEPVDHPAIACTDVQRQIDWYCRVLGMRVVATDGKTPPGGAVILK